jgi:hypothetical protein
VFKGEPAATNWVQLLHKAHQEGALCVCEIVVGELSRRISPLTELRSALDQLIIQFDPLTLESACLAGEAFEAYRRKGGTKDRILPDFFIGAHALRQADRLAAIDRGYFRSCFAGLKILSVEDSPL